MQQSIERLVLQPVEWYGDLVPIDDYSYQKY